MSILEFRVEGYRSIRDVRLELNQITVVKGANGVGKSNLYNGLCLLAKAASGEFAASIAADGGMPSILWAGPPKKSASRKEPKRMKLELRLDDFNYQLECGLTPKIPPQTRFDTDPQIKSEFVWYGNKRRKSNTVLERRVGSAWVRDHNETVVQYPAQLIDTESALAQLHEPHLYPELSILREKLRWWRFYHTSLQIQTPDYVPRKTA